MAIRHAWWVAGRRRTESERRGENVHHADELVTVVDFQPLHRADAEFESWLDDGGLGRSDFGPRDLVIDTGPGETGSVRRYRVHVDALRRLRP